MKKEIVKTISSLIAVLMLISVFALDTFAVEKDDFDELEDFDLFNGKAIVFDCPQNYDEDNWAEFEDSGYFASTYSEWETDENGEEYYTGNTVDITCNRFPSFLTDDDIKEVYSEEDLEWTTEFIDGVGKVTKTNFSYQMIGGFEAAVYDVYYRGFEERENGKRREYDGLYSRIIFLCYGYETDIEINVTKADDLLAKRDEMLSVFMNSMKYDEKSAAETIRENKKIAFSVIGVLFGIYLIFVAVVVTVVLVAVKPSKKKKVQNMPYQQDVTAIPPQYYNMNGNPPVNNSEKLDK